MLRDTLDIADRSVPFSPFPARISNVCGFLSVLQGKSRYWTPEEHRRFLEAIELYVLAVTHPLALISDGAYCYACLVA